MPRRVSVGRAARSAPRAQAAHPRAGAAARMGPAAPLGGDHRALLRLVHSGHLQRGLRPADGPPGPRARLPRGLLSSLTGSSHKRRVARGGALALVLHTHMPYVEGGAPWPRPPQERNPLGFGTWPFGEEWLWEAIATSYLPLLGVLGRAPITLSLTPVLCDQLESPGALERCLRFLTVVRRESHRRDIDLARDRDQRALIPELERSASRYSAAADRLQSLPRGMLGALRAHA